MEVFEKIYEQNLWASQESKSGSGSELKNTVKLRSELAILFKKYNIKSILDIPCGDFNWMNQVDLTGIDYIGGDIVPQVIQSNKAKYPDKDFRVLDLCSSPLPKADLIITRDCLGHLSTPNVHRAIENIKRSNSLYLLATTFTKYNHNPDIEDGGFKCINLMIAPHFLQAEYLINEDCREGYPHYQDKSMILVHLQ